MVRNTRYIRGKIYFVSLWTLSSINLHASVPRQSTSEDATKSSNCGTRETCFAISTAFSQSLRNQSVNLSLSSDLSRGDVIWIQVLTNHKPALPRLLPVGRGIRRAGRAFENEITPPYKDWLAGQHRWRTRSTELSIWMRDLAAVR